MRRGYEQVRVSPFISPFLRDDSSMDSSTPERDIVVVMGQSRAKHILLGPSTISPDEICSLMNI